MLSIFQDDYKRRGSRGTVQYAIQINSHRSIYRSAPDVWIAGWKSIVIGATWSIKQ